LSNPSDSSSSPEAPENTENSPSTSDSNTDSAVAVNSLSIEPAIIRALDELKIDTLTDIQSQTIGAALANQDIIAASKTGSGKTFAFLIPILHRLISNKSPNTATRALVLVPTRELAIQIQQAFEKLARYTYIKCGLVIGGEAFKHQIAKLRKNPEVLIATPGRLVEHLDKGTAELQDLECLVLDEADQMLKMGFSEDLNRIADLAHDERQNFLFSATLKQKGMHRIEEWFKEPLMVNIDQSVSLNQSIEQHIIFADDQKHKEKLTLALIDKLKPESKVFIFCNTRAQCQHLGNFLKYKKYKIGIIHSEIAQSERKTTMHNFRKGHLKIVTATDVAARGLDIDQVDLVINFAVAQTGDDHTHRIGRTGRAGKQGKAVTFVTATEYNQISSIERYLKIKSKRSKIDGLEGSYKGPKKVKSSGKASGAKKKDKDLKGKGNKKVAKKSKANKPAKKSATSPKKMTTSGDGFGALKRRK